MNICDNLPLYLYDEMNEAQKQEFEKHIAVCGECASSLKAFDALKNKERLDAPLNVINNIFYKTTRKKSVFEFSKSWKLGLAAAACLLIGIFAMPSRNTGNPALEFDRSSVSFEEIEGIDADLNYFETNFML